MDKTFDRSLLLSESEPLHDVSNAAINDKVHSEGVCTGTSLEQWEV
jgi:hypothetical protein